MGCRCCVVVNGNINVFEYQSFEIKMQMGMQQNVDAWIPWITLDQLTST